MGRRKEGSKAGGSSFKGVEKGKEERRGLKVGGEKGGKGGLGEICN